ncbi:hypothetical protein [Sulfurirhabdus autotrophica]|uniref:Uncharacterized protein n=1 Tax=Sulfurirhabdus autotrophica TaxID=1706046 RepID=A0A4R3Y784_9PROT|nr:hypothetical protein [Sulfurirhabdus autotrophica]TCV86758.1 hypothetical protein EDC63_106119 [Sulfurirhabdus autotrophica]
MNSHFLNHIIAKALGTASNIEPRLLSRFESFPDGEAMPGLDTERQTPPLSAGQSYEADHNEVQTRQTSAHTEEVSSNIADDTKSEHHANPQPQSHLVNELPKQSPRSTKIPDGSLALREPENTKGTLQNDPVMLDSVSQTEVKKPDMREVTVAGNKSASPSQPALLPAKTKIIFQINDEAEPVQTMPHDEPDHISNSQHSVFEKGTLVPDQIFSQVRPKAERLGPVISGRMPQEAVRDEVAQSQQVPVINVTIGRVEVRAIQGSPGKPRVEPVKQKPMDLDEYLKQQRGRR